MKSEKITAMYLAKRFAVAIAIGLIAGTMLSSCTKKEDLPKPVVAESITTTTVDSSSFYELQLEYLLYWTTGNQDSIKYKKESCSIKGYNILNGVETYNGETYLNAEVLLTLRKDGIAQRKDCSLTPVGTNINYEFLPNNVFYFDGINYLIDLNDAFTFQFSRQSSQNSTERYTKI